MELNYSDEELAMLPYYCVFQYEKDPALLQAYRRGVTVGGRTSSAKPIRSGHSSTSRPA